MANLDIHPSALAELKSAISWYLEQNETTANKFVAAVDRAIDLILESPRRWPAGELGTRKFVLRLTRTAIIEFRLQPSVAAPSSYVSYLKSILCAT
jgi:plasmid stabilization system protein ParE